MPEHASPRVLVVDDTEGNRYATSRILRQAGFTVTEAATGSEALAALLDDPDVVVLDVNLPDMTGFEVVERMRRSPEQAMVPVLHLSASYTTTDDKARGLDTGADAYLTHPIDPPVFVATVRALVRSRAADRRLQEAAGEWQATFDALADAVFLLDHGGSVHRANRAAYAFLGTEDHAVIGQRLATLLARTSDGQAAELAHQIAEGERPDHSIVQVGARTYCASAHDVRADDAAGPVVFVLQDVSERVASEQERERLLTVARQARLEAEGANRAKNEFLAVMSHELRTPLNAIGGYAQLLDLGIRGPVTVQQRADLERITRSQTYLLGLINDVLNFTKIESGHLHVELTDHPVNRLIEGMSDFVQPQLRDRGLTYRCRSCDPDVQVRADGDKLQQILLNLLSNALKFTPSGGAIELSCSRDGDSVRIRVRDTGRGIAADKLEYIFEPFVQVDRRYKREQEGIGLGLAISRELARAMSGELRVESRVGEGSTFELQLPSAPSGRASAGG